MKKLEKIAFSKKIIWYGSGLSIQEVREIAPCNSATSLQVVGGLIAGMIWAIKHPKHCKTSI